MTTIYTEFQATRQRNPADHRNTLSMVPSLVDALDKYENS
jgi:hypothetical protein